MNVLLKAGSILYQRPGEVKLYKVLYSTWYPLLGEQGYGGQAWSQIGVKLWTLSSNVLSRSDNPNPTPEPTPVPEPVPNPALNLWFVKHDLVPRGTGDGMPETCRCGVGDKTRVTAELRDLIIAVHCLLHPNMTEAWVVNELKHLFRTNGGWNNGRSNGWDGDFRLDDLNSGGWTASAISPSDMPPLQNFAGKPYFEVKCMNLAHLDPQPKTLSDIDLEHWFFPTTATHGRSNPFPNFDNPMFGGPGRCLVPFVRRRDTNWVKWINENVSPPMIAVERVGRVMPPHYPFRWDITKGLIDP